jgi:hypothetical protein
MDIRLVEGIRRLQKKVYSINTEKKINSKLNTFIYKPRYEKMPKTTPFLMTTPPVIPTQTGKLY